MAVAGAAPASAEGDTIVVAAFGDSLVAGFGLPVEDGFAPQLERWLHAQGATHVRVSNAGVSGDTTSGGLARLDWSIGSDVDAVILELGANDALRGVDPAIAEANLDAILSRLSERGLPVLLAGMRAPANWGADYADAFAAMYPALAERHGAALYPFFFAGLLDVDEDPAAAGAFVQPDGLHPNAAGVARIVDDIGPFVLALVAEVEARPEAD